MKQVELLEGHESETVQVTFRKFPDGDVIALFPNEVCDTHGNITSYMRIGQHGAASPVLLEELPVALRKEYTKLLKELESIGYEVEVI